jgi:hypothetical protein
MTLALHNEYSQLIEDCRDILVEAVFASRWSLIEGYHMLGKRVTEDEGYQRHAKGNAVVCKGIARSIGLSERTLYYALQFYAQYPNLQTIPEGKTISWTKLITKYLPTPDGKPAKLVKLCPFSDDIFKACIAGLDKGNSVC